MLFVFAVHGLPNLLDPPDILCDMTLALEKAVCLVSYVYPFQITFQLLNSIT